MHDMDLRLKLLGGDPIEVSGVGNIYPITIGKIKEIGYTKYARYLNLFTLNPKELLGHVDGIDFTQINGFDLIASTKDESVVDDFSNAIKLFFQSDNVYYSTALEVFYVNGYSNDRKIDRDNYLEIKSIIEYQNYMNRVNSDKFNPSNESAARIAKKLEKARQYKEKISKSESDGSDIDIVDIISAVSTKSNTINKFNVWGLTIYQLYDEFKRLEMADQYDIGIRSILAGAKSEDVDVIHWSNKIK